jgi:hypothetical protein
VRRGLITPTIGLLVSMGACQLVAGLQDRYVLDASVDAQSETGISESSVDAPCETCGGTTCINLDVDTQNCGYCHHACSGCAAGLCPPTTLASSLSLFATAFASDTTNLYLSTAEGLQYMAKSGAPSGAVSGDTFAYDIATAGGLVYFTELFSVGSVAPDGSGLQTIYARSDLDASTPSNNGIVTSVPTIFWSTSAGIFSVLTDGDSLTPVLSESSGVSPSGLAVDSTNVYTLDTSSSELVSVPQSGGNATELAKSITAGRRLVVSGGVVYWGDANTVHATPLDGGPSSIVTAADITSDLAAYGTNLFWTVQGTLPNTGAVMMVSLPAGAIVTLAANLDSPVRIVVDATSVYWLEAPLSSMGAIRKVPW